MTAEVLAIEDGRVGRLRLNRPSALHALTEAMCGKMADALLRWRDDPGIHAVMIDHAPAPGGDPRLSRGFCAGGDVRAAAKSGAEDGVAARAFFAAEYRLNHLLFVYAKPIVTVMDGVVMGGGAGLALPARHRLATEHTVFAMPETGIGLFPDVGAGWYLSRLAGRLGPYLALTGARLNGAECVAAGLATHHVPVDRLDDLKRRLIDAPVGGMSAILADLPPPAGAMPVLAHMPDIDRLFAAGTLEGIVAALEADGGAWAAASLATLRARSPQACKIALRLLREGRMRTDFADEMRAEYAIAARVCQRHDFREGVRALLVDKDHGPQWQPTTPEEVTDALLDAIFAPLPEDEAWQPLPS